MERIIETNRIYLREFISEDAHALYKLNQNPVVLKYTGDVPFSNLKKAQDFVKSYDQYQKYNMGRWAVCGLKKGEFFGWCGLKYHPEEDLVEVGYRFFEKHWNKGYATEATKSAISYGFNALRIQHIYAFVDKRNTASMRVAEKAGLTFKEEIIRDGLPTNVYHIKNNLIEVKIISSEATYPIRHQVLRQGKPIETCKFDGDDLSTTFHIGLFYYNQLVGIATYLENNNDLFNDRKQFQLRGMAILQPFQGKRFGDVILKEGEKILKEKGATIMWCNAREIAKNFYQRFGLEIIGKPFDIPTIGKHFTMYKKL